MNLSKIEKKFIESEPNYFFRYLRSHPALVDGVGIWSTIINNPNIPFSFILEKHPLNDHESSLFESLSDAYRIPFDFFRLNISKPWNWTRVCRNVDVTLEFVKDNLWMPRWCWTGLSRNRNITFSDIKNNSQFPWNWREVSKNPNITFDDVKNNLYFPWDWKELSANPTFKFEDIKNHLDLPWNWCVVCHYNQTITVNDVETYITHDDKWRHLSYNSSITLRDVLDNLDKPWYWVELSHRLVLPTDFFRKEWFNGLTDKLRIEELKRNESLIYDCFKKIRLSRKQKHAHEFFIYTNKIFNLSNEHLFLYNKNIRKVEIHDRTQRRKRIVGGKMVNWY